MFKFCGGYFKRPDFGRLCVIYGNNGVGKTHCLNAVYWWANHISMALPLVKDSEQHDRIPNVRLIHWPTFIDNLKGGAWDSVISCEEATLLLLDEVGGGHDPSRVGLDKLCRILSKRERKWTMVTTNLVPDMWEEAFDRRVASRLFREADHVDLTEVPDYSSVKSEAQP